MSKFKLGDKVICISKCEDTIHIKGKTGTIIDIYLVDIYSGPSELGTRYDVQFVTGEIFDNLDKYEIIEYNKQTKILYGGKSGPKR